jgi:glycosyltransferase involved in cell wall biosynthesis
MKRPTPETAAPARPVVYVTPFRMATNAYIEMQKALVSDCGFEPRPLSVRHLLLEGGWRGLLQRRNLVLAQWIEMRAFRWRASQPRLSVRGLALFLFYLALLRLARAPVVYVVHDHAVHDTAGFGRMASRRLIGWCRRVADHRVVHDPQATACYDATYLPHPLFWDRPGAPALPVRGPRRDGPLRTAMLGAIRPYKAIDTVLQAWPVGRPLVIAGRAEPDLHARLLHLVAQRGLQADVTLDATHQSDAAFAARLQACDVLILPHASNTAMVSGAFFEAIGQVPWLIARRSSFIEWAARQFPQVLPFDTPEELPALLCRIEAQERLQAPDVDDTRRAALQRFGWQHARHAWAAFLAAVAVLPLTIDL